MIERHEWILLSLNFLLTILLLCVQSPFIFFFLPLFNSNFFRLINFNFKKKRSTTKLRTKVGQAPCTAVNSWVTSMKIAQDFKLRFTSQIAWPGHWKYIHTYELRCSFKGKCINCKNAPLNRTCKWTLRLFVTVVSVNSRYASHKMRSHKRLVFVQVTIRILNIGVCRVYMNV